MMHTQAAPHHCPRGRGTSLPWTPPLCSRKATMPGPHATGEETEAQGDFPLGLSERFPWKRYQLIN